MKNVNNQHTRTFKCIDRDNKQTPFHTKQCDPSFKVYIPRPRYVITKIGLQHSILYFGLDLICQNKV